MRSRIALRSAFKWIESIQWAVILIFLVCWLAGAYLPAEPGTSTALPPSGRIGGIAADYGKLPLSFELNQGQTDRRVKYLSRGNGYTLFLTPAEAVLALWKAPVSQKQLTPFRDRSTTVSPQPESVAGAALRIKLLGANPKADIGGEDELPGKSNYFMGNDPKQWHSDIPNYQKVRFHDVYPGVDLVYYGNQQEVEHDFVLAPGAEPGMIRFAVDGARRLNLDHKGDLVLEVPGGQVLLKEPKVYQEVEGKRHEIPASYRVDRKGRVSFKLAAYDRTQTLVIDPVLVYSTYLGNTAGGNTQGVGIAIDSAGSAYIAGLTASANFPTTTGALQTTFAGSGSCTYLGNGPFPCNDVFVAKMNPVGTALVYSTFIGGSADDEATGIVIDASGNAYVTGFTNSTNFPVQHSLPAPNNAFQGLLDAFVLELNTTGSALVYSTYLGASQGRCLGGTQGCTQANGISVDASGNAYVSGWTFSSNFATTPNAYQTSSFCPGCGTVFISKLSFSANMLTLAYSTYYGGGGDFALREKLTNSAILLGFGFWGLGVGFMGKS